MTKRFFLNNSGGGGGRKASDMFKQGLKKGNSNLSPTERNKQMVQEKMAAMLQDAASGKKKFSFSLPGTAKGAEKQESEAVKQMKAQLAQKKAKRDSKKLQEAIKVEPKYFSGMQGGRIDSKGNIYNAHNQLVATVEIKSGKIMGVTGVTIGKYVPNSPTAEYVITRYIAKMNNNMGRGGVGGGGMDTGGASQSFDGMTGGIDSSKKGSIWGRSSKKKDTGWW